MSAKHPGAALPLCSELTAEQRKFVPCREEAPAENIRPLVSEAHKPATPLTDLLRETAIGCDHMNEFGLRDMCNEAADTISDLLGALEKADQFIANGIEFGHIRMPDADMPDSAHMTPGLVREAIGKVLGERLCEDCPPTGYPTDETRCTPCPRRGASCTCGDSAMVGNECKGCGARVEA